MVFPFLVVLTIFFLVQVKNVNSKLNNPDDTSFGSETSASKIKEDKDDDFPPVDEEFKNDKEPERESEPVFTQTQEPQPEPEPEPEPQPVVTGDLGLEYQINSWGPGYTVNFRVVNKGEVVNTWKLKLAKSDVKIDSSWCVKVASEGDYYVITPEFWNSTVGNGATADFGIQGSGAIGNSISYTIE